MKHIMFLAGLLLILNSCNSETTDQESDTDNNTVNSEFQYPEEHLAELGSNCPCPYCSGAIDVKDDYLYDLL